MGPHSRKNREPAEAVLADDQAAGGTDTPLEGADGVFERIFREAEGGNKTRRMRRYDFRQTDKFSADQQKFLQRILSRLGESLTSTLARLQRTKVQVELAQIRVAPYQSFQQAISEGSTIVVFRLNPEHKGVLVIDYVASTTILDLRMGGRGMPREGLVPFSDVDRGVLRITVKHFLEAYRAAWREVQEVFPELEVMEFNPLAVHLGGMNETMVVAEFTAQVSMGKGKLHICLPFSYLKPVVPRASFDEFLLSRTSHSTAGGSATPLFAKNLEVARVPLTVELGQTEVLFQDLLSLEAGDILKLDAEIADPLKIKVNNRARFLCRPGVKEKKIAVKIVKVLNEGDEGFEE